MRRSKELSVEPAVVPSPSATPKSIEALLLAPGVIVAIANAVAIIVQAIQDRYDGMDDKNKARADNLLLNAGERIDRVFGWIDRKMFGDGDQPQ